MFKLLKQILFFYLISQCISCVGFDSSIQTAHIVPPKKTTRTYAFHYFSEHDTKVMKRRFKNDYGTNFDTTIPELGFSYHQRWGWKAKIDLGLELSMANSGGEIRRGIYSKSSFNSTIGTKLLFPTLSIDKPSTYCASLILYNSYDISQRLSIYLNPSYIVQQKSYGLKNYLGTSFGILYGTSLGVLAELSYYQPEESDYEETIEQVKIAIVTGIENIKKDKNSKLKNKDYEFLLTLGFLDISILGAGLQLKAQKEVSRILK